MEYGILDAIWNNELTQGTLSWQVFLQDVSKSISCLSCWDAINNNVIKI